jgi:hypothetical protein
VRTFDVGKLQDSRGVNEHGISGRNAGLGLGLPSPPLATALSGKASNAGTVPAAETTGAAPSKSRSGVNGRKTSLKAAFRRSFGQGQPKYQGHAPSNSLSSPVQQSEFLNLAHGDMNASEPVLELPKPSCMVQGSRHSSRSSDYLPTEDRPSLKSACEYTSPSDSHGSRTPVRPSSASTDVKVPSWYGPDLDDDLKATVLAMQTPGGQSSHLAGQAANESSPSDGGRQSPSKAAGGAVNADSSVSPSEEADMAMLQRIADQPGNRYCADCYRSLSQENAQRWATISLHQRPTCAFLCIRCAGVHRSLGTHISKVRSPDLDRWTPEAIIHARAWGNARSNAIWERLKPADVRPPEE